MSLRVRALLEHHFALRKEFPVKKRRVQDLVKVIANRAGITKELTPHVLRHTFATTALQKGISLATVQKILGHDRLRTTAISLHFTDTHIQEEFEWKWSREAGGRDPRRDRDVNTIRGSTRAERGIYQCHRENGHPNLATSGLRSCGPRGRGGEARGG